MTSPAYYPGNVNAQMVDRNLSISISPRLRDEFSCGGSANYVPTLSYWALPAHPFILTSNTQQLPLHASVTCAQQNYASPSKHMQMAHGKQWQKPSVRKPYKTSTGHLVTYIRNIASFLCVMFNTQPVA